jgi:uncharacterized membrane protein YbhN (UPF0104 family)
MSFLFLAIYSNYSKLTEYPIKLDYRALFFAVLIIMTYLFVQALVWKSILKRFGVITKHLEIFWAFFISIFGKYIPGKIWLVAMRIFSISGQDKGRSAILGSIVFEQLYLILSGIFYFFLIWGVYIFRYSTYYLAAAITGLFLTVIFILKPYLIINPYNSILLRRGHQPVEIHIEVGDSVRYFLVYLGTWIFLSIGVWFASASLVLVPFQQVLKLGSAFAISFVAGFIVLLAPSGLGVREGVFAAIVSGIFPIYIAVIVAIILRLAFTVAEIAALAILVPFRIKNK